MAIPEITITNDKHEWIDGKWSCSTHEEVWDGFEQFDTPQEAMQYAIDTHCGEQGLEFDRHFWIGKVKRIDPDDVATLGVDVDRMLEAMGEGLYDLVGEVADGHQIEPTPEQQQELESLLTSVTAAWLHKHKLIGELCTFECIKSETYARCDASDGYGPEGGWRCELGLGHTGAHEYEGGAR